MRINNVDMIELTIHLKAIEAMTDPKEVLEYLSESKSEMGWHLMDTHFGEIRMEIYYQWLRKNKPNWAEHFIFGLDMIRDLLSGRVPSEEEMEQIKNPPEGYIQPMPFLRKGIVVILG